MSDSIVNTAEADRTELADRAGAGGMAPIRGTQRIAAALVLVGLGTLAAVSLWKARDLTFIFDDWGVLVGHYDGNYLTPLNGHLIVVPILIYQALLKTFGLGGYYPFLVVGMAISLAVPLLFHLVHRRLASPLLVALVALLYAWSAPAVPGLVYPFLIDFNIPLLCLLGALHLTESGRWRDDLVAAGLVAIALGSSGLGVAVAFAVIVDLVVRRPRIGRLGLFVVPVLGWVAWYLARGGPAHPSALSAKIAFAWRILTATFQSIAWGSPVGGLLVAIGCIALVVVAALRWQTLDRRGVVLMATIVVFVGSCAWARAGDHLLGSPDALWYQAVVFLLVSMVVVRCLRGVRLHPLLYGVGVVVLVLTGSRAVHSMHSLEHDVGADQRPFLAALEAMGPRADPGRKFIQPGPGMTNGRYVDLVERYGSVVGNVGFSGLGADPSRIAADAWMIGDEHVAPQPYAGTPLSCPVGRHTRSTGQAGSGETARRVRVDPGEMIVIAAGPGDPVEIRARRFARTFAAAPIGRVVPSGLAASRVPDDRSPIPWEFRLTGPSFRFVICARN